MICLILHRSTPWLKPFQFLFGVPKLLFVAGFVSSSSWRAWNLSRLTASACKTARLVAAFVLAAEIELP